jgi:ParB family chromosome partitioning protein
MGATDKKQSKKSKRARLGRGLSSLVDAAPISVESAGTQGGLKTERFTNNALADHGRQVIEIPLDIIEPNPHQPRRVFDQDALDTLAHSIREHGLMQPIVVRLRPGDDRYELIAGERRWRAAQLAGLETIRAIIDEASDERSAQLALIENMQRTDLNPIERAMGLRQLLDRFGATQQRLAERMGMSRSGLANLLRLLDLDPDTQQLVAEGSLSVGHAKVLLSCEDASARATLAQQVIEQGLTVRDLEDLIANRAETGDGGALEPRKQTQEASPVHPDRVGSVLRDLERSLSEHFGTKVTLKTNRLGTKGRVQIEFYDLDQFDGLLAKLGIAGERV